MCVCHQSFSCVWLFATPWIPLSIVFPRKEYWSGLSVPSPEDLLTQRSNLQVLQLLFGKRVLRVLFLPPLGKPMEIWEGCICLPSWKAKKHMHDLFWLIKYQFSSVAQWCPTICDPKDCSLPGFPVYHQLLELAQTHVHQTVMSSNHFMLCHLLLLPPSIFPSIRSFQMSQFFASSVLEFQLQHQSFQWIFSTDFL